MSQGIAWIALSSERSRDVPILSLVVTSAHSRSACRSARLSTMAAASVYDRSTGSLG